MSDLHGSLLHGIVGYMETDVSISPTFWVYVQKLHKSKLEI
jgi:hypothetical protein